MTGRGLGRGVVVFLFMPHPPAIRLCLIDMSVNDYARMISLEVRCRPYLVHTSHVRT